MLRKIIFNTKAFTVSEVLVTVAIVAALSAIAIPQYARYRIRARRSEALRSVNDIVTNQKSVYAQFGSYSRYDGWAAGASGNAVSIGRVELFNACPLGACGQYNYSLAVGNSEYTHVRRDDGNAVNGLWPSGAATWTMPTNFERFVVLARGAIAPPGPAPRHGDVVFYDSAENQLLIVCDDERQVPNTPVCHW